MKDLQKIYTPSTREECFERDYIQDIDGDFYLEQEALIFTPEELKQLLEDYTNRIVGNVKMKFQPSQMEEWENVPDEITRKDVDDEESGCENFWISVNTESITTQLPEFLKELGL